MLYIACAVLWLLRFALGAAYDEAAARALLAELGLGDVGGKRVRDWSAIKSAIKNDLSGYLYKTTKRNPMVIPVVTRL